MDKRIEERTLVTIINETLGLKECLKKIKEERDAFKRNVLQPELLKKDKKKKNLN